MMRPGVERRSALRGTARRVLIVPQPGNGPFEQAICIVRGDCSVSEAELLKEAMEAAGAEKSRPRPAPPRDRLRRCLPWLIVAAAALLITAAVIVL